MGYKPHFSYQIALNELKTQFFLKKVVKSNKNALIYLK